MQKGFSRPITIDFRLSPDELEEPQKKVPDKRKLTCIRMSKPTSDIPIEQGI